MYLFSLLSLFVPYEATKHPIITQLNDTQFRSRCITRGNVITLIINNNTIVENSLDEKAVNIFTEAMSEFSSLSEFYIVPRSFLPLLTQNLPKEIPCLIFLYRATVINRLKFPFDESTLMTTLNFWSTESPRQHTNTVKELYSILGTTPYAFIFRDKDIDKGFTPMLNFSRVFGATEIVSTSDKVFTDLNMSNETGIFHRRADRALIPIPKNYTLDTWILFATSNYKRFDVEDTKENDFTFVGFISNETEMSIESEKTLSKLVEIAPEFDVVFVSPKEYRYIEATMQANIAFAPDVIVFNYDGGYYYKNENAFKGVTVRSEEWVQNAELYINKIRNHRIPEEYYSDDAPENETEATLVHTVVGFAYKDFVDDPQNDVIMLTVADNKYNNLNDAKNNESVRIFTEFAKEVIAKGVKNIKFGIINPSRNSSPKKFPRFLQTYHAEVFLRGRKNDSESMYGNFSKDSLARFSNRVLGTDLPHAEMLLPEAVGELNVISNVYPYMSESTRLKARVYLRSYLKPILSYDPYEDLEEKDKIELEKLEKERANNKSK